MSKVREEYMIKDFYEAICQGREVRQSLISLRQELKKEENKRAFAYLLGGDFQVFVELLEAEDPKIRKNTALILGEMETEDVLPFLFAAYQKERTLFVRSDYLKAMSKMDYRPYLEKFKHQLEILEGTALTEENRKHVREEMTQLQNMILKYDKPKKHVFIGYETAPEVLLVTNRCQKEITKSQITEGTITELGLGLKVKNGNLKELLQIRTCLEILFPIPGAKALSGTPDEIGKGLAKMGIADFLEDNHKKSGCFYYRVEVKGSITLDKKGAFIRKVSEGLESSSGGRLKNSATDYEVELRLLQKKDGSFVPMLKLFTVPDGRFGYRKEVVSTSISPMNASLTAQLAREYLKEGAQILDPFCGVGTMLIERNKVVTADPMYGVDIFGEAIEKARKNTERAGNIIHYINRDFFDFTHGYLFDEIITDMPRTAGSGTREELAELYHNFFVKALSHLKPEGIMVLYTMNPELVQRELSHCKEYEKKEEFLINEKNQTKVFVLQVRG